MCLLVGGGYGGLHWLAAPEDEKSASEKSRPVQKLAPMALRNGAVVDSAVIQTPGEPQPSSVSVEPTLSEKDLVNNRSAVALKDQDSSSGVEESSALKVDRNTEVATAVREPAAVAPIVPTAREGALRSPRSISKGGRAGKRKLAVMTLRTIQFSDGRQVTQLLPYRTRDRAPFRGD